MARGIPMTLPSAELVLVLDFSAALSVGLVADGERTLAFRLRDQGARGETAHSLLEECLAESGRGLGEIGAIGVGVGPGSFTGIRVCAAMAQGLAFPRRLPIYPFSSLAGILTGTPASLPLPESGTRRISAIAANGGRYFVRRQGPEAGTGGRSHPPAWEESLLSADALLALGSPDTLLITAGHFPDRERMRSAFAALERHEDVADFPGLARLALAGTPVTDGVLRPNYLMASAAEEKRKAGEASP
jgi:tRNA threonylcarbamoyladenosine biosynthesis protein TsaB